MSQPPTTPVPVANRPVLLLTCGDPAGIGPEIIWLAWAATPAHARARLRVVGDADLLAATVRGRRGLPSLRITSIAADDPRASAGDELLVIDAATPDAAPDEIPLATITATGGRAAATAVLTAHGLVNRGLARAIVTGPLHKEALRAAGYDVPGHTELLARACGLPDDAASMMLWLPSQAVGTIPSLPLRASMAETNSTIPSLPLRASMPQMADVHAGHSAGLGVVHVTLHESLSTAIARLSTAGIVAAGQRLAALLAPLLGRPPRIAVAALNPHGGEGGLFGDEEARLVMPAVATLRAAGLDAAGPLPADTLFLRASRGEFDGVVALYHDQGHIPIKLLGMHRAVNITLGLPLVRTSVAHGTGFDIVGTGAADPASMLAAIDAAERLVHAGWPVA